MAMLREFKSQLVFKKTCFMYWNKFYYAFYSAKSSRWKIFNERIDPKIACKQICHTPPIFQSAEKSQKKYAVHTISEYAKLPLKSAQINSRLKVLLLNFDTANSLEYPVVWLRDNCQCKQCFDPVSNSRIHAPLSFTNDVIPKFVTSSTEAVFVHWEDEHRSEFQKRWLCKHSFQTEHQAERLSNDYVRQVLWNAEDFGELFSNICFRFDDLMTNDNLLLKWMETLASVGITKITGVPRESGQIIQLGNRISFIRKTHYGEEYYIRGEFNANNVAYQKGPLQMHTDLPYYHYNPGVVFLHYIVQSHRGGENILADGLNIVRQLSKRTYDILVTTLVDWLDIGFEKNKKFISIHRAPVICVNFSGDVEKINWSQPQRNSAFNVSAECAALWYEAFKEFSTLLHDHKNTVTLKIEEGNILAFDNRRIVHGRTDFADKRFLCGAYMDWDEIYSKIRVLKQDLEEKNNL